MQWIRHKIRYEALSNPGRKPRRATRSVDREKKPLVVKRTYTSPTESVKHKTAEWIKELAQRPGVNVNEMELQRGVRLAIERGRKGGFDGYTLEDLHTDRKRFEPLFLHFLIAKKVLEDLSVIQARRAAKIRECLTMEGVQDGKGNVRPGTCGGICTGETVEGGSPHISPEELTTTASLHSSAGLHPNQPEPISVEELALKSTVEPDREELIECTLQHLAPMWDQFRMRIVEKIRERASGFMPQLHSGTSKHPSESFSALAERNFCDPEWEANGILRVLCSFVHVSEAVQIVEEAYRRTFGNHEIRQTSGTISQA
jgi:hypothetical protein